MAKVKVLAGDFSKSAGGQFTNGILLLTPTDAKAPNARRYNGADMVSLSLADEKAGIKVFGAVGWGAVGAVIAGPVGAIVGGILGGRGEQITFIAEFNGGRKLLAQCEKKVWLQLMAQHFDAQK